MNLSQLKKFAATIIHPAFWPAIAKGTFPALEHVDAIKHVSPKTLIDVGANKGQFSLLTRFIVPDVEIEAFEPLESESSVYRSVLGPSARLHRLALGESASESTFFVASRPDSSSLCAPGEGQKAAYGVETKAKIRVPVARLCDVLDLSNLPHPIMLKLDVQGGELSALKGAEAAFPLIDFIYCETSYVRLYDGDSLVNEIIDYLLRKDFALRGVFNQNMTRKFGPTQADFLFEKT
jgi:FkbM family methyltransferase